MIRFAQEKLGGETYIRKFDWVFDEISTAITTLRPAIIEHNILVPQISEAKASHSVGCIEENRLIDIATKCVPYQTH
jgi:hypothetical protein